MAYKKKTRFLAMHTYKLMHVLLRPSYTCRIQE